jgi:hypothetical protein
MSGHWGNGWEVAGGARVGGVNYCGLWMAGKIEWMVLVWQCVTAVDCLELDSEWMSSSHLHRTTQFCTILRFLIIPTHT